MWKQIVMLYASLLLILPGSILSQQSRVCKNPVSIFNFNFDYFMFRMVKMLTGMQFLCFQRVLIRLST